VDGLNRELKQTWTDPRVAQLLNAESVLLQAFTEAIIPIYKSDSKEES